MIKKSSLENLLAKILSDENNFYFYRNIIYSYTINLKKISEKSKIINIQVVCKIKNENLKVLPICII